MTKKYKATHKLKKNFVFDDDETYSKGTLAHIVSLPLNIAFVDKRGQVLTSKSGALALFSEDFFLPREEWFEKL